MGEKYYSDVDGWVHIQQAPGKDTYWLGECWTTDALPNPKGDAEPIWCVDRNRDFQAVGSIKSPPGKITTTLTGLTEKNANWLEKFTEDYCDFWLHYIQSKCGQKGVWGNWERVYSIHVDAVPDDVINNLFSREGGNPSEHAFSLTGMPPRIDSRKLTVSQQVTVEANAGNSVWACPHMCPDSCGEGRGWGEDLAFGADGNGATANVNFSYDYGVTWTAGAADPFTETDEDVIAGTCFEWDRDTTRHVVARIGAVAAVAMEVAYTDNGGGAWTEVTVGATANEGGLGPKCLFSLDYEHIWVCTDAGNVYFSSDGAVTWTDQGALGPSGGNELWAIQFIDENVGYAVGAADTVIKTTDGGTTWAAATATGAAGVNKAVHIFTDNGAQVCVGEDGGEVRHSWDGGVTWTQTRTGDPVIDFSFSSDMTGLMITSPNGVGTLHHTVNGGDTWQALTTPTNLGLNAVIMLTPTWGYVVGEVTAGAIAFVGSIAG